MHNAPETRHSLILKLRDLDDSSAWREFVELYEPLIRGTARKRGLQEADANDFCQDVLRAVAQSVQRWDPELGSFRGWLNGLARNLLINMLSRKQHLPRGSGATSVHQILEAKPAVDPAAAAVFEIEYRRRLFQWSAESIKSEFSNKTWQAFWKTAVEDLPPSQVADELGSSVGAVYVARCRVLARLKKKLEDIGDHADVIKSEVEHDLLF